VGMLIKTPLASDDCSAPSSIASPPKSYVARRVKGQRFDHHGGSDRSVTNSNGPTSTTTSPYFITTVSALLFFMVLFVRQTLKGSTAVWTAHRPAVC